MNPFVLLICIVPKDKSDFAIKASLENGASGATVLLGRGTASNKVLQILGLGSSEKDIVLTVVSIDKKDLVLSAIKKTYQSEKKGFGIVFVKNVSRKMQNGVVIQANCAIMEENPVESKKMITVILNKGYAEDAMAAARAAGASGGTILNAMGTAKEGDEKFFGITIVPEKEMLLLIVDDSLLEKVFSAVQNLPCLAQPGSGIIYSSDVSDFAMLGKIK